MNIDDGNQPYNLSQAKVDENEHLSVGELSDKRTEKCH